MANNTGVFFNINDNDGIPLVGVSTDGRVFLDPFYGNVGVGITNPTSKLHVLGDSLVTGVITASSFIKNNGTSNQFLKADGSLDNNNYLTTDGSGTNLTGVVTSIVAGTNITISGSTGQVTINSSNSSQWITTAIGIHTLSNVGIGTTNPQGILQVGAGTSTFIVTGIGSIGIGSTNPQKSLDILGTNNSFIRIGKIDGLTVNAIWLNDLVTSNTWNFASGIFPATATLINSPPGSEIRFLSGGYFKHKIDQYGNFNVGAGSSTGTASQPLQVDGGSYVSGSVGIGTTNPTSKLHVIGDARVGINTSQGVILTSENGTKYRLIVSNAGALSTILVP